MNKRITNYGETDKTEFTKIKNICSLKKLSVRKIKIGYVREIFYVLYI